MAGVTDICRPIQIMTNKEIARQFNTLAKIMELHGENPFKIRSYSSAYNTIRRLPQQVVEMNREELLDIKGIGKNIADKIEELKMTGQIATLQRFMDQTPPGIVQLLGIKGLGAKKIIAVWKDLGVESPGELLYACEENRLIDLKGFGEKTQQDLHDKLVYFFDAQGKYLFGHIEEEMNELLSLIRENWPDEQVNFVGDFRRQMPIVEEVRILSTLDKKEVEGFVDSLEGSNLEDEVRSYQGTIVHFESCDPQDFYRQLFEGSASSDFLEVWTERYDSDHNVPDEELMKAHAIQYIPPEARETSSVISLAEQRSLELIEPHHVKGVIHSHTTYSDGANTIEEMASASHQQGYEYILITDHSKSAFYASGLREEEILRQHEEIDLLNEKLDDFRIFKGIESDILYDGNLDYEDDVLEQFDVIIASVHSNLKMDQAKATQRVITAVANPHTRILGHPTGRLLLSRAGYPIDHMAVIDACAEYNVAIELNANPYRLDLDWSWIPYAVEKNVLISINPDAHNINGISDIKYGVSAARKALLQPSSCLNTFFIDEFVQWIKRK